MVKTSKTTMSIKNFIGQGGSSRDLFVLHAQLVSKGVPMETVELLKKYYYFLTKTDVFSPPVRNIVILKKSYSETVTFYNINETTLRNKVFREVKKLFTRFIVDPYYESSEVEGIKPEYLVALNLQLDGLIAEHNVLDPIGINDSLLLDLSKFGDATKLNIPKVDEQEFVDLVQLLKPISKPFLDSLLEMADTNVLNYLGYLLSTPNTKLTSNSQKHKKYIQDAWWIGDDLD